MYTAMDRRHWGLTSSLSHSSQEAMWHQSKQIRHAVESFLFICVWLCACVSASVSVYVCVCILAFTSSSFLSFFVSTMTQFCKDLSQWWASCLFAPFLFYLIFFFVLFFVCFSNHFGIDFLSHGTKQDEQWSEESLWVRNLSNMPELALSEWRRHRCLEEVIEDRGNRRLAFFLKRKVKKGKIDRHHNARLTRKWKGGIRTARSGHRHDVEKRKRNNGRLTEAWKYIGSSCWLRRRTVALLPHLFMG